MSDKKRGNGLIELYRFMFCMAVLFFHAEKYFLGEPGKLGAFKPYFFVHGAVGVEFFFVCTGFFLARSIRKRIEKDPGADLGKDTISFMLHKVKSIAPVHIVFFVLAFISLIIVRSMGITDIIKNSVSSVPAFFLVQMLGFTGFSPNHVSWYLSVMLISMFVIYPLARRYYSVFVRVVAPALGMFILGYLFYKTGSLTGVMVRVGIFYKSLLRGFAEILIGLSVYEIAEWFKTYKNSRAKSILITVFSILIVASSWIYIMFTLSSKYEYLFVPISAVLLIFAYSEQGLLYNALNNKLSVLLGKLTLPVYLSQVACINIIGHFGKDLSFAVQTATLAVSVFALSALYLAVSGRIIKK